MKELELSEQQIWRMIEDMLRNTKISGSPILHVVKSDSYGAHFQRTWVFHTDGAEAIGSIERYWSGLKMICSVFGGSPRTSFFTEDGIRTTNKGLKTPVTEG